MAKKPRTNRIVVIIPRKIDLKNLSKFI